MGVRRFVVDMTPRNLRIEIVPSKLNDFYGDQLKKATFVVLLREPLSRMQSSYYHGLASGWAWTKGTKNFAHAVQVGLSEAMKQNFSAGIYDSMYAPKLSAYLRYVKASQFIISPMKNYF